MREEVEPMRVFRLRKKLTAAIVGAAVFGALAGVALGSVGVGFTPKTLATGTLNNDVKLNSDRVKFQTKDRIDIAAGGVSGWHHHPGIVIVTVTSGQVTFTNSDCSSTTYGPGLPAGSVFVEGGDDPGQASSVAGATVFATFVAPHADPPVFRIEDTAQSCP
jgi:quercetin dioxygenase-like cupin family protein